jgi:3-oxoadipate enol-lactonase
MPDLARASAPTLHYQLHDYTDPWKKAPYILLQHGYGRHSQFWYSWIPYLSRYYKVICPDMRGFGRSRDVFDSTQAFTFGDLVRDVLDIMDHAGAQTVHYCGEAFGGTLGMQIAAEHPDRVRTLNLMSAPVFLHQKVQQNYALGEASWFDALRKLGVKKWAEATNNIARFPPQVGPAFLDWYSTALAETDAETLITFSKLCSSYNMTDFLPRIQCPVLGVYPNSRPEQVELLRKHLARYSNIELPTEYYMIYSVYPRTCAEALLYFAGQHDGIPVSEQ